MSEFNVATKETAPCKECGNRVLACHQKCQKYKKWKDGIEKIKEARKKYLKEWRELMKQN